MPNDALLPIAALDTPVNPARTEMSEEGLSSLARSIKETGLLEPLLVGPEANGRHEVWAGHRRLLACREAGLDVVPCRIFSSREELHAVRMAENLEREELHPVDEAIYYFQLFEELGEDTERVAVAVRRPRDYVERRMALLRGDPGVRDALRAGKISLGVAEQFNRVEDPEERSYFLEYAIRGGCSLRQAADWRAQANARTELRRKQEAARGGPLPDPAPPPPAPPPGGGYLHMARPHELSSSRDEYRCLFCDEPHEAWQMYRKYVCAPCADRELVPREKERLARA